MSKNAKKSRQEMSCETLLSLADQTDRHGHARGSLGSPAGLTSHFPLFSPVLLAKDGQ